MAIKSKPDGGKFGRIKVASTKASDVIVYMGDTFGFELKMSLEKG